MITIVLTISLSLLGWYLGSQLLVIAAALVACLQFVRLKRDFACVSSRLADYSTPAKSDSRQAPVSFRTPLGRACNERLEALRYRLTAMEWQLDTLHTPKSTLAPRLLDPVKYTAAEKFTFQDLYHQVLSDISARVRADVRSMVWTNRDNRESVDIVVQGDSSSLFQAELVHFAAPYCQYGDDSVLGVKSVGSSGSLLADFSRCGILHILTHPFQWTTEGGICHRGVIFLGYKQPYPPTPLEIALVEELTRDIEKDIPALLHMHALTGRAAEAESAAREKSEFLAHMSHDIRSPLNNIRVALHLIGTELIEPRLQEILQSAELNCNNMNELLETILDYSRHRVGKLVAHPERIEIGPEIRTLTESFSLALRNKQIKLSLLIQSHAAVHADRKHVKRILTNLLSNAIKFTEPGGNITITYGETSSDECYVEVQDTGRGISEEQTQKLFQPFTRLHSGVEGIGLGLALSKVLLELNNGKVAVSSRINEGSIFTIVLPRSSQTTELEPAPLRLIKGAKYESPSNRSVLIVDDDVDCVASLAQLLRSEKYRVLQAHNVPEAISMINFESPQALITDSAMPGGGALALLEFVHKRHIDLPILVLSGESDSEKLAQLQALGANAIMSKPVIIKDVMDWLRASPQQSQVA